MVGRRGVCRDRTGLLPSSTLASCTLCFSNCFSSGFGSCQRTLVHPCLWSSVHCHCFLNAPEANAHAFRLWHRLLEHEAPLHVKTREVFKNLRVEPSGKVTAANSYPKHNPTHYNQTNRHALTKLCFGQAAQNKLSSCGCKAVLQAPDFTSFSLVQAGNLQGSSRSNTHFSGCSRLLRNFQNKQFQTGFKKLGL